MKKGTGLRPKGLNRVAGQISANKAKPTPYTRAKKKTKTDVYREFCLPEFMIRSGGLKKWVRYSDPYRGMYWYWLSRDVRKKEWEKWGGLCLTCLQPIEKWQDGQCGHIVASKGCGEFLRFNRINLTIQHSKCNNPRFSPNAGALNAIHYDQRHGQGAYERLYAMRKTDAKEPNAEQYRNLIQGLQSYQEALKTAQQSHPIT